MEKVNQELAESYKNIEGQIKEQEEDMASLSKKSDLVQRELNQAVASLEIAEREAKNNNLITVKDIENARKKVQYAKYTVEDHCQAIENLKRAITNAGTSVQKLHKQKAVIEKKIWEEYREIIRAEIKDMLGGRMEKFWTAIICANPDTIPTHLGFPGDLNFLAKK